MTFITSNYLKDLARNSASRGDAQMANAFAVYQLNRIFATPTLTIGGTTTKVGTGATVTFTVGGTFATAVATTDNVWTFGGANSATVVAASSYQKYALLWDSTGASGVAVYEARQNTTSLATVDWTNISIVSPWAPFLTMIGSTFVVVGVVNVVTDATHTFTPGTTAFGAAGITTTYTNGIDQSLLPLLGNPVGTLFGLT